MRTSAGKRTEYEMDNLPRKMMNNRILVKVDGDYDDGTVISQSKIGLVVGGAEWNEAAHIVRHGVVAAIPDKLVYRGAENVDSPGLMEWGTEMELRVGDTVFFGAMSSANAESLTVGDDLYYVIPYSRFILCIRNGEIIMLNGYALLKEVVEKTRVRGLVLDFGDHVDKQQGIVTHYGKPNSYYFGSEAVDAEVEVGDHVVFEKKFYGYLEDEMFAVLPKGTGYCQRCWVIAKL